MTASDEQNPPPRHRNANRPGVDPVAVSRSRLVRAVIVVAVALGGIGWTVPVAHAAVRQVHLSILKCQFSDDTTHAVPGSPVNTDQQIADFLAGTGTDGIPDFVSQFSEGRLAVDSTISGWYTMPTTLTADPTIDRTRRIQNCIDTAQNTGWSLPAGHTVIVFRNQCTDRGTVPARSWVLLDPCSTFTQTARDIGYTAVQMLGSSDDPWSLTGTGTVFTQPSRWGPRPVGPNGYQLATSYVPQLSWPDRTAGQVTLAPLYGSTGTTLPRVVVIPHDTSPSSPHSLVIEYRYPQGMDAPIGAPVVLLHQMDFGSTTLLRAADGSPLQNLVAGTTSVHVVSTGGPTATVTIDTGFGLPRVPDLIGATRADANRTVLAAGLAVSINSSAEPTCAHLGQVVGQVPDAGTAVDPGSRVLITIAGHRGPCPVE